MRIPGYVLHLGLDLAERAFFVNRQPISLIGGQIRQGGELDAGNFYPRHDKSTNVRSGNRVMETEPATLTCMPMVALSAGENITSLVETSGGQM